MYKSQNRATKVIQFVTAMAFMLTACGSQGQYQGSSSSDSVQSSDSITNDYQFGISQNSGSLGSIGYDDQSSSSTEQYEVTDTTDGQTSEASDTDTNQTTEQSEQSSGDTNIKLVSDKLVYRCNIQIETKSYDDDLDNLLSLIDKYEGIIQNSNETDNDNYWYETDNVKTHGTKSIELEVRIPQAKYKEFIDTVGTVGKVRQNSQQVDNISYEYYNTQADIEQLKIQESRLLDMMKQAQTIDEMITVEDRLTEVQNELSKLQTKLVGLDTDVAYSYVNIRLDEVYEYSSTPVEKEGFLQRLGKEIVNSFKAMIETFEDLIILVLAGIPRLIPFALVAFIIYKAFKYYMRHRKPRKPKEKRTVHNNMYYGPMNQGWYNGYNPNMSADGFDQSNEFSNHETSSCENVNNTENKEVNLTDDTNDKGTTETSESGANDENKESNELK